MKYYLTAVMLLVAVWFVLTPGHVQEARMTRDQCTAMRIAERYIAVKYPQFDSVRFPPVVHERGTSWEVSYELSPDMLGGTPVITIDKVTLKVIGAYHTQ
jgi:hypothetical protein